MEAKLDKLLTAGLDPIKLLSRPFWAPLQPKQPAKQPAQQPAKRSNPQDAKPAAKRQARQPAAAADDAGVGASAAPAAAAPAAAAAAAPRKRQRKRQRRAPSPAAAGGRGASKELTVKEAIEAVLGQLEVRIGGTLVDMVRQAQLQLVLPATGSLREQIAAACAQVEVETGWQVDDPHDPTPMTASAAHGLTQLSECVSPPVSKHVSAVARRTTDRAATTHDTWAPRVHDAGHPPTVTREASLRRITRMSLIQPNYPLSWSDQEDPANFNQELSEARSRVFLIDPKSGCVVGFACSSENTVDGEHGDSVIVDMVVTSSEFYGFGLGRFMVKTLLETCHPNRSATVGNLNRRVSTAVFAKVDMGHAAAKGLWQSLGLQRQCKTNGASNFMCGMFSEVDLGKDIQWWSGWTQETIDDYRSKERSQAQCEVREAATQTGAFHAEPAPK